jgi:RNA polymerase sigma-70 factor (ECF subfamily)
MKRLRSAHAPSKPLSLQWNAPDIEIALEQLQEPYRTVLALHYLEHLTYPQMAQQLHCPLGTVKSMVSRANKLLRQHVSPGQNADIAHGPA